MANPDRARGLRPVYHANGGSWNNALAVMAAPADDAVDGESDGFFIGSCVFLANEANTAENNTAGLPLVYVGDSTSNEPGTDAMFGVVVGIGRPGETGDLNNQYGAFNPVDLGNTGVHLTQAEIENDSDGFVLYCAPADGWVFEGQVEAAEDSFTVGEQYNLNNATVEAAIELGNVTTGQSSIELVAVATEGQFVCVGFRESDDNDTELANKDIYVRSTLPFGGGQNEEPAVGGVATE